MGEAYSNYNFLDNIGQGEVKGINLFIFRVLECSNRSY